MFITPYLTEVDRIISSCPQKEFKQPMEFGSKLNGIKYLLRSKRNIVSTHSLFNLFDDEVVELVKQGGYILIMDEVASVIDKFVISKYDAKTVCNEYTSSDEDGRLHWETTKYEGRFEKYKAAIESGCVYYYNNNTLLWMFPVEVFRAFANVYIMTYMFDAQLQKYYFDYHGVTYRNLYIEGNSLDTYRITDKPIKYKYDNFKELIHVCEDDKFNHIGEDWYALSKAWYARNAKEEGIRRLRNNCYNFFRRVSKTASKLNLWTTFSEFQDVVAREGYTRGFLSCNSRATNKYREKVSVAYLINRFLDPNIKNFFVGQNITVDEENYALSEMLQFLWRSAIRDGKEVWLYIPSKRMRTLLLDWINERSTSEE